MSPIAKLTKILNGLEGESVIENPTIRRLRKSSIREFRPKSANDVDRLTYLSTLIYVLGNQSSAEALLKFVDENTGRYSDGRQDLASELAFSRLIWAYLARARGAFGLHKELLIRPEIESSANLTNIAPRDLELLTAHSTNPKCNGHIVGVRLVSDILLDCELRHAAEEDSGDNTTNDLLRSCYHCFLRLVVVRERSEEIREQISTLDDMYLDEGIEMFLLKMKNYLQ